MLCRGARPLRATVSALQIDIKAYIIYLKHQAEMKGAGIERRAASSSAKCFIRARNWLMAARNIMVAEN